MLAFKRSQQISVNSWNTFLEELTSNHPFIRVYELPIISNKYLRLRFMIDGGMKAGISYREIREQTITIYLNKKKFLNELDVTLDTEIYLFLINKSGEILWKTMGAYSDFKGKRLQQFLTSFY
ncbi:MAG: hypothetical protein ACOC35_14885 [Promethearchaeia archaeon]